MLLGLNGQRGVRLNMEEIKVSTRDCIKLLGIETDEKLKFNKHVKMLFSK